MTIERPAGVSFKGVPKTVIGATLQVGDPFPDVTLDATDWSRVNLKSFAGKVLLVSVVPSLDTGICDAQTRRFDKELAGINEVTFVTISADLPWAQRNWVKEAEVKDAMVLSDHESMAFGDAAGTHVKEMRIEQRAVFVVDRQGIVAYAEYVPEIAQHPDYDAALSAVRQLL